MTEKLFKICGVGLDTTKQEFYNPNDVVDYLYTTINSSSNLTPSMIPEYKQLIVSIDFLDKIKQNLEDYLVEIEKDSVDLLLIESSCDYDKYIDNIKELIDSGLVPDGSIGLSNPEKVKDLENFRKIVGEFKYISLDINPLKFNYDIIKWCEENNVDILGFNVLGDELIRESLIDSFSIPYLLGFAAHYCKLVFMNDYNDYLKELIGKETSSIYELKKNTNKIQKPLKKIVYTSLKLDDNTILPYELPDAYFNPEELVINLGSPIIEIPEVDKTDELVNKVYKFYEEEFEKPEDANDFDILAILRNNSYRLMKESYPIKNEWISMINRSGSKIFILSVFRDEIRKKGFISKEIVKRQENYALYYSNNNFMFKKLESIITEA